MPIRRTGGFSLIELLVVMLIIGLLAGGSISVIAGMNRPTAYTTALSMQSALQLAHSKAVSLNTYSRVAWAQAEESGAPALVIGVFVSRTGLDSAVPTDWMLAVPPTTTSYMAVASAEVAGTGDASSNDLPPLNARAGGRDLRFSDGLVFSPSGSAADRGALFERFYTLRIENTSRANEPPTDVFISALTGTPELHTPSTP